MNTNHHPHGYGSDRYDGIAILPAGESINPRHPETATYYDKGQTALVLFKLSDERTRPTRVVTGFGENGWIIGDELHFKHDQTGAYLGQYRVVGVHHFASGEMAGDVPDSKIKHAVFK